MDRPYRVLFAIPELASGGPDRVFFELICGMDRSVFAPVIVVSHGGGRYFDALPVDAKVCILGPGRYPVLRFAQAVNQLSPDIIMSTLRMSATAAAARPFQREKVPLIARQANAIALNFSELRKRSLVKHQIAEVAVKALLRVPDALVAQSSDMARELKMFAREDQKISVIGNPISLEETRRNCDLQCRAGGLKVAGNPAIIAVGRLSQQKGFDLLLPAFAEFLRSHSGAILSIFGEGPERGAMEDQCKKLNVTHAVQILGQSDKILAELAAADIFVSSSRYEGFSNAMLEAAALGTTVVAANCEGATKDIIFDGRTGILVEPYSVEALAQGLKRAMTVDRVEMAKLAQIHVSQNYGRTDVVNMYLNLFMEILNRGNPSSLGELLNKSRRVLPHGAGS